MKVYQTRPRLLKAESRSKVQQALFEMIDANYDPNHPDTMVKNKRLEIGFTPMSQNVYALNSKGDRNINVKHVRIATWDHGKISWTLMVTHHWFHNDHMGKMIRHRASLFANINFVDGTLFINGVPITKDKVMHSSCGMVMQNIRYGVNEGNVLHHLYVYEQQLGKKAPAEHYRIMTSQVCKFGFDHVLTLAILKYLPPTVYPNGIAGVTRDMTFEDVASGLTPRVNTRANSQGLLMYQIIRDNSQGTMDT